MLRAGTGPLASSYGSDIPAPLLQNRRQLPDNFVDILITDTASEIDLFEFSAGWQLPWCLARFLVTTE
jgi:hypothetical protein